MANSDWHRCWSRTDCAACPWSRHRVRCVDTGAALLLPPDLAPACPSSPAPHPLHVLPFQSLTARHLATGARSELCFR